MTEELKQLIEKIQKEGVQAAEAKARQIEEEARRRAQEIVAKAGKEAAGLLSEAEDKTRRMEESTKTTLQQAGRDLVLSLKKEVNDILRKLVEARVREALDPEELAKIITALVKDARGEGRENVVISLKKEDAEKIREGVFAELKDAVKKGIVLKPCEDISGGLTISYDAGKSLFDFTDKALTEYITSCLKPKLKDILG